MTPSALYGLSTAPLTATALERLGAAQRKMLRLMVGYVKFTDDSWADMHRRMSGKISEALEKYPIGIWKDELSKRKQKLIGKIESGSASELVQSIYLWDPASVVDEKLSKRPRRCRGRPPTSWDSVSHA